MVFEEIRRQVGDEFIVGMRYRRSMRVTRAG